MKSNMQSHHIIDFGNDVPIFTSRTIRFFLRNNSSQSTSFSLAMDHFEASILEKSVEPSPPATRASTFSIKSAASTMKMSLPSEQRVGPSTREKNLKEIPQLKNRHGAAF